MEKNVPPTALDKYSAPQLQLRFAIHFLMSIPIIREVSVAHLCPEVRYNEYDTLILRGCSIRNG